MQKLTSLLDKSQYDNRKKQASSRHQLAATVDLIEKAGLVNEKYNYKYWLGKVKRSGFTYTDMVGILKEIQGMDPKYSKGGRLTNILSGKK